MTAGDGWPYSPQERSEVAGATSPACGASRSVVGPTLGGVFAEYVSWRWIFFINIPLCLVAAAIDRPALPRAGRARPAADRLRRRGGADRRP